jgi:prepilin-type N-terminal cleavage/methylation domain-containing protein
MSQRIRPTRAATWRAIPAPRPAARGALGFTLVELLVVMVIISILLGFILNAAMDSVKRGQERATQALITKLDAGLSDRFDALMQSRPDPAQAHKLLGSIYGQVNGNPVIMPTPPGLVLNPPYGTQPWPVSQRAQVIAWYDFIKSEMPDTFYVQLTETNYPINFAGNPYPYTGPNPVAAGNFTGNELSYVLPMGNAMTFPQGDGNAFNLAGTGIYGASYPIAAGIYKNLGYQPIGYDAVDNNGNGLIDELAEGAPTGSTFHTTVMANLANHTHKTARAEMLYAILVEGRGPLGSVFNRDDFTDKEVQDTDGDGLPEFVDAWGNPLQFFRWPILYHSDIQLGQVIQPSSTTNTPAWAVFPPYLAVQDQRDQDPLDQNQQLVGPAWWGVYNSGSLSPFQGYPGHATTLGASGAAQAFEFYFHKLTEPYPNPGGPLFWDRGAGNGYGARRAFYSKFLILSGGLDGQLGVFLYSDAHLAQQSNISWSLIANENNALPFSVNDFADFTATASYSGTTISYNPSPDPTNPSSSDLIQFAGDDISNQNLQTSVAIGGSR